MTEKKNTSAIDFDPEELEIMQGQLEMLMNCLEPDYIINSAQSAAGQDILLKTTRLIKAVRGESLNETNIFNIAQ